MAEKVTNTKTFLYNKINEKNPDAAKEYKNLCERCYLKLKNNKGIIITYILALIGFGLALMVFFCFKAKGDYYTSTHAVPMAGIAGGFVYGVLNCIYGFIKIRSDKPYSMGKTLIISYILFAVIAAIVIVFTANIDFKVDSIQIYNFFGKYFYIRADETLANVILRITCMLTILSIIILICYFSKYRTVKKVRLNYYNTYIFPLESQVIMENLKCTNTEDYIKLSNLRNWDGSVF